MAYCQNCADLEKENDRLKEQVVTINTNYIDDTEKWSAEVDRYRGALTYSESLAEAFYMEFVEQFDVEYADKILAEIQTRIGLPPALTPDAQKGK